MSVTDVDGAKKPVYFVSCHGCAMLGDPAIGLQPQYFNNSKSMVLFCPIGRSLFMDGDIIVLGENDDATTAWEMHSLTDLGSLVTLLQARASYAKPDPDEMQQYNKKTVRMECIGSTHVPGGVVNDMRLFERDNNPKEDPINEGIFRYNPSYNPEDPSTGPMVNVISTEFAHMLVAQPVHNRQFTYLTPAGYPCLLSTLINGGPPGVYVVVACREPCRGPCGNAGLNLVAVNPSNPPTEQCNLGAPITTWTYGGSKRRSKRRSNRRSKRSKRRSKCQK